MKIGLFKSILFLICVASICLCAGCSILTSAGKSGVSQAQILKLHEQIKSGQYEHIYNDSAEPLQRNISREKFVNRMNEAVKKMREIDETLTFQKSELRDVIPDQIKSEFLTPTFEKIEKNGKKIEVLAQWYRENKDSPFKLRSFALIEQVEEGKHSIYSVEKEKNSSE